MQASRSAASSGSVPSHAPFTLPRSHDLPSSSPSLSSNTTTTSGGATFPRQARLSPRPTTNDAYSSPIEHLSPPSPWHNPAPSSSTMTSSASFGNSPVATRASPELSAFYGNINSSSVGSSMKHSGPSSPAVFGQHRQYATDYGFGDAGGSRSTGHVEASGEEDESLFFQRDPFLLPRRNHTIASGAAVYRKRLDQHFNHTAATSPSKNSLSAITGGKEDGDDDWEAMMRRKEDLVMPDEDEDEPSNANVAWRPMGVGADTSRYSLHRRFPSQPASTFGTSPIDSHSPISGLHGGKGSSAGGHQRSESADLYGRLDQGAFASSPIVPGSAFGSSTGGVVRRHQSLNHHTGRNMAARLHHAHNIARPLQQQQNFRREGSQVGITHGNRSPGLSPIGDGSVHGGFSSHSLHSDESDVTPSQRSDALADAQAQLARMSLRTGGNQAGIEDLPSNESRIPSHFATDAAKPKLQSLITNRDALARAAATHSGGAGGIIGPVSASAYVPPIGHAHHRRRSSASSSPQAYAPASEMYNTHGAIGGHGQKRVGANVSGAVRGPQTAVASGHRSWRSKEGLVGVRPADDGGGHTPTQANIDSAIIPSATLSASASGAPLSYPSLPDVGDVARLPLQPMMWGSFNPVAYPQMNNAMPSSGVFGNQVSYNAPYNTSVPTQANGVTNAKVRALIASKGYNPPVTAFNTTPAKARFFVIKSFTEDDVQRSLKHEIWASTEKGNQRLDRAFKESSTEGPLYLLFSVNASGHFCGVAEMLTPLDYSSDSTVWVQEGKWKGTFKVRWIYVKDVPNNKLRHIRLTNTTDCKPITQSRDTQELPTDGGKQALKIIAEFPHRTSLLQDWLFYESQNEGHTQQVSTTNASSMPTKQQTTPKRAYQSTAPLEHRPVDLQHHAALSSSSAHTNRP